MVHLFQLLILALHGSCTSSSRSKRVLHADIFPGRTAGYSARTYFAGIGTAHSIPWYAIWDFLKWGQYFCGGALITRDIVQTACHCLTESNSQKSGEVSYPSVKHGWEDEIVVYFGVSRQYGNPDDLSMSYVRPFRSRRFVVHQKCVKLPKGMTFNTPYDFGWIILDNDDEWTQRLVHWVNFAPQYTIAEIDRIWKDLMSRGPVCLHLGFGKPSRDVYRSSDYLRHGWARLINQGECVARSATGMSRQNITNWFTWVCTAVFSRHYQPTTEGDSGGPFSCNDLYFGLVSGAENYYRDPEERLEILSFHQPLVAIKSVIAIDNRDAWVRAMLDYAATAPESFFRRKAGISFRDGIRGIALHKIP